MANVQRPGANMFSSEKVFFFLHIVGVVAWLGGWTALWVLQVRFRKEQDSNVQLVLLRQSEFYGRAVVGAAAAVTLIAGLVSIVPDGMLYEPKWDGFRCVVFRDGDEVELGSRNERPLTRYFPELAEAAREQLPQRCVIDGEVVVASGPVLDFEALQQRIHPAASRVNLLAEETPGRFIGFDLLALGDQNLLERPFAERRALLEEALSGDRAPYYLTPMTDSHKLAERWFRLFEGAGLDGVIAKPPNLPYLPDQRAMFKVKHERTADCVVAGFRWHKSGPVIGSMLLGLYNDDGKLQHVGVTSSFTMTRRR